MPSSQTVHFLPASTLRTLCTQLSTTERETLDVINQKVAAAESLEKIMEFVYEETSPLFPCDRISLAFIEDNERRVVTRWIKARYSPLRLRPEYSEGLSATSLGALLERASIRIIDDLEAYSQQHPASTSSRILVEEGVRSSLTCPLIVEGRRLGFLFRSSRSTNAYGEHEVMLHAQVAERLSQAVEKAHTIEQLTASNRAYREMLSFASHELRSPLSSLIMDSELLLGGYLGEMPPPQRQKLERIVGKAQQLLVTTKDYLDLARLEGGKLRLQTQLEVPWREKIIDQVLEVLEPQRLARQVLIEVQEEPESVRLSCDPELMRTVFLNLIGNAIKYGQVQGLIRIKLVSLPGALRASVWNSGPGFSPEQNSQLFKKFSRLAVPEFSKITGTGVGLYNVWQIIQLHGGRIWADSKPGAWAEFAFELPVHPTESSEPVTV